MSFWGLGFRFIYIYIYNCFGLLKWMAAITVVVSSRLWVGSRSHAGTSLTFFFGAPYTPKNSKQPETLKP